MADINEERRRQLDAAPEREQAPIEDLTPPPLEEVSLEEIEEYKSPEGPPQRETLSEYPEDLGRRFLQDAAETGGEPETAPPDATPDPYAPDEAHPIPRNEELE
jgi:hypothetical protein